MHLIRDRWNFNLTLFCKIDPTVFLSQLLSCAVVGVMKFGFCCPQLNDRRAAAMVRPSVQEGRKGSYFLIKRKADHYNASN